MKRRVPAPGQTAALVATFLGCVLLVGLATIGLMALFQIVEALEEQASEVAAVERSARPTTWVGSFLDPA